jgi:serine/threonine-protein kinase
MTARPTLLLVDDEERILRSLAMLFRTGYTLRATTDVQQALALVAQEPVHVVVSDQRMPAMRGAELLRRVKERSPNTLRILLTGYSELDAVVASVNEGEIFRFVSKPWDAAELRQTVDQAAAIARELFAAAPQTAPAAEPGAAPGLLVIDDDAEVVKAVREIVGPAQPLHWARSLDQALDLLARHDIGVIISELVVARETIAAFLKLLKAQHPEVVTIVMTPVHDTRVLIGLINQGQVYRFLPKPVRRGPLGMNIASALRHHRTLKHSPKQRAAHAVEKLQPAESSVAGRVMGLLARLRSRPDAG